VSFPSMLIKILFEPNAVLYLYLKLGHLAGEIFFDVQLESETKLSVKGFVKKCPNLHKLYHEISMTPLAEIYPDISCSPELGWRMIDEGWCRL